MLCVEGVCMGEGCVCVCVVGLPLVASLTHNDTTITPCPNQANIQHTT